MSTEPATEKQSKQPPAARRPGPIARLTRGIRNLRLPARAAIVTAILLLLLLALVTSLFVFNSEYVPWQHSLSAGRIAVVLILVIAIPFVVYYGLRLWLEGEQSRFPEIDFAWRAGLDALERSGLSVDSIPLFLVLGSAGERFEQSLLAASGMSFRVRGVPEGPAPLHWYANPDRIFLVCSDIGWLSALAALLARKSIATVEPTPNADSPGPSSLNPSTETEFSRGGPTPNGPSPASTRGHAEPSPVAQSSAAESPGTVEIDQISAVSASPPSRGRMKQSPGAQSPKSDFQGTVEIDQISPRPPAPAGRTGASQPASSPPSQSNAQRATAPNGGAGAKPAVLAAEDSAEQVQRLQYLCRLLRRARQPLCGINGLLTLLPFDFLRAPRREHDELQKAIRADLATVEGELRLQCAVTTLIVGMERERGFRELVRRVGRDRAAMQRFGKGFNLLALPTRQELTALCAHVCGAFEDWFYMLFREQGVLSHPGNRHLYSLLCKIRGSVKGRLVATLTNSYGYDPQAPRGNPTLYSGCYLAATGNSEDRQAFVRGVFDKLEEEQENVQWTDQAIFDERRAARLAVLGVSLCVVLLVTLGMMILQTVLE